jgi:hypothetical protein
MAPARSFRELKVYERAPDAVKQVFVVNPADDFCKHGPATDYRSVVRDEEESPFTDH